MTDHFRLVQEFREALTTFPLSQLLIGLALKQKANLYLKL